MAAYVLADWPTMQALTRVADRGVNDLAETSGVEIRIKRKNSAPMHLKSYQIDGRLLRTGAANFSASALKRHGTI